MTNAEVKQLFRLMRIYYPSSEYLQGDLRERVDGWTVALSEFTARDVMDAFLRLSQSSKFCPGVSELIGEIKRKAVSCISIPSEWSALMDLCERINSLRGEFGYTYQPPGETRTQGEMARAEARELYDTAPWFVRGFLGSYSSLLQYAYEISTMDDKGLTFRRRDYEQWRSEQLKHSTIKELSAEIGGLLHDKPTDEAYTRGVIGYNGYTPVLEDGA